MVVARRGAGWRNVTGGPVASGVEHGGRDGFGGEAGLGAEVVLGADEGAGFVAEGEAVEVDVAGAEGGKQFAEAALGDVFLKGHQMAMAPEGGEERGADGA
jgi:hypothetical protein